MDPDAKGGKQKSRSWSGVQRRAALARALVHDAVQDATEKMVKLIVPMGVPEEEARDKLSFLVNGVVLHLTLEELKETRRDGKDLAAALANASGKSREQIAGIRSMFGDAKTATPARFKAMLEQYLGVPTQSNQAELCVMIARASAASVDKVLPATEEEIDLSGGVARIVEHSGPKTERPK